MAVVLSWEPQGVHRKYVGDVSIRERRESLDAICADPRFDDLRYSITDYLEVGRYETSRESTEEIAALHIAPLRTNPRIALAAVATRPDILASIQHFQSLKLITQPYAVFATEAAARDWLKEVVAAAPAPSRPWGY